MELVPLNWRSNWVACRYQKWMTCFTCICAQTTWNQLKGFTVPNMLRYGFALEISGYSTLATWPVPVIRQLYPHPSRTRVAVPKISIWPDPYPRVHPCIRLPVCRACLMPVLDFVVSSCDRLISLIHLIIKLLQPSILSQKAVNGTCQCSYFYCYCSCSLDTTTWTPIIPFIFLS